MTIAFFRTAVVLGLLTAMGPFAIDMYLPALPIIGDDLNAGTTAVQLSLQLFLLTMGLAQLVVGPLSDMLGRKTPLYIGIGLFMAGSIGAALAPTVEWLIAFRVLQGFGAAAGMVVPRAVVRDLHTGNEAARLMSLLMLVFSVSPILAPLTGSLIIEAFGWRAVFWAVTIVGFVGVVLLLSALEETRPPAQRIGSSFRSAVAGYRFLMGHRRFLGLTFIGGFGISGLFVYLMNSPFVLIDHYNLSPVLYSLCFSVNAVSFFSMSQLTGMLADRFGLAALVRFAVAGFAAATMTLFVIMAMGYQPLWILIALLFIAFGFLGLIVPTTSVMAMDDHGEIAGTASALMGMLHFATGAAVMAVAGLFFDGTPLTMVIAIAIGGLLALTLTRTILGREPEQAARAPAE